MKADTLSPASLFDGKVRYEIPAFQRPYVWDEESQWAPLWADIVRVAERVVRADSDNATAQIAGHFLGAVVYESKPPVVGDVTRHVVIDGQQRTTTLQILLDAIHQVLVERGHDDLAEDLEGLILNKASTFKGKPERFKLWPLRGDRAAFSQAMDPQPGGTRRASTHRCSQVLPHRGCRMAGREAGRRRSPTAGCRSRARPCAVRDCSAPPADRGDQSLPR